MPPFSRFVRIECNQGSSLPVHWRKLATVCIMPDGRHGSTLAPSTRLTFWNWIWGADRWR